MAFAKPHNMKRRNKKRQKDWRLTSRSGSNGVERERELWTLVLMAWALKFKDDELRGAMGVLKTIQALNNRTDRYLDLSQTRQQPASPQFFRRAG